MHPHERGGGRRCLLPVSPCLLLHPLPILFFCLTFSSLFFSCLPLTFPFLLSLPSQEVDCHGNVVQERVEQAMEEIKDRLTFLEKRGRAEVGEELEANDSAHVPIVTFELFVL